MPVIEGYRFAVDLEDRGFSRGMRALRGEANALKSVMRANFAQLKEGEGSLSAYTQRIKDAQNAIDIYKKAIDEQTKAIDRWKNEFEASGRSNDALAGKIARAGNTVARYQKQITGLEHQMTADRAEIARLSTGIDSLRKTTEGVIKVNKATEDSFRASGKIYAANKTHADGLKSASKALSLQLKAETLATKRLGNAQKELQNKIISARTALSKSQVGYNKYNSALKRAKQNAESHRTELVKLISQYGKYDERVKQAFKEQTNLDKAVRSASINLNKHKSAVSSDQAKIGDLTAKLGKNSQALSNQASKSAKVAEQLRKTRAEASKFSNTRLGTFFGSASQKINRFNTSLRNSTSNTRKWWQESKGAFAGVGVAVSGAIASGAVAVKKAADVQQKYKEINNLLVTSGEKSSQAIKYTNEMERQGTNLSLKYGYSQKEIASGYEDLVRRGYSGVSAMKSMNSMLLAARASGDDYKDVLQVTSEAVDAFGLRVNNATKMAANSNRVANALASGADRTASGFRDMGVAMTYAAAPARTLGFNVEETSAAIGELSNAGIKGSIAGTSLRKIFNSLSGAAKGQTKAMKEAGLQTSDFIDKSGKMKSIDQIFKAINEHTKGWGKAKKGAFFKAMFGATGMSAAEALAKSASGIEKNDQNLQTLIKHIKGDETGSSNYIQRLADKNMKSVNMQMKRLKTAVDFVTVDIGNALLPAVNKVSEGFAKWVLSKEGKADIKEFSKGVQGIGKAVADHIDDVMSFTKGFAQGLKDDYHILKPVGDALSGIGKWIDKITGQNHTLSTSIGRVAGWIAGILATSKVIKVVAGGISAASKDTFGVVGKIVGKIRGNKTGQDDYNKSIERTNDLLQQSVDLQQKNLDKIKEINQAQDRENNSSSSSSNSSSDVAGDLDGLKESKGSKGTGTAEKAEREGEKVAEEAGKAAHKGFFSKLGHFAFRAVDIADALFAAGSVFGDVSNIVKGKANWSKTLGDSFNFLLSGALNFSGVRNFGKKFVGATFGRISTYLHTFGMQGLISDFGRKSLKLIKATGGAIKSGGRYLKSGFIKNVKGMGDAIKPAIKGIGRGFKRLGKDMADSGKFLGKKLVGGVNKTWTFTKDLGKAIGRIGKSVGSKALNAGKFLGRKIVGGVKKTWSFTKDLARAIGRIGKAVGSKALNAGKAIGRGIVKGFKATGNFIKATAKWLANGAKTLGSKALSLGKALGSKIVKGIKSIPEFTKGLFGKGSGGGFLRGSLQSMKSAGGFKGLTTVGKVSTGIAGAGVALDAGSSFFDAFKHRHNASKRSESIGKGIGAGIGGGIGLWFGGPLGAAVGAKVGSVVGKWGGQAVNKFTKGWQSKKPPKKFWSLANLGWSTHDMFKKVGKWGQGVAKNFQKGLKKDKKRFSSAWKSVTSSVGKIGSGAKKNLNKFSKWLHKGISKGASKAGKAFKKGWDYMYKHSSKGTKQIMRSTSKFAKRFVKTNKKANDATRKNFGSFSKRLKKNHGDLFKTIGQTAKTQLKIEKKRWSSNWKNIKSTAKGIWKGIKTNAGDLYKGLNRETHGGLGKVLSGFQSFGKTLGSFWSGLFKGIKNTFDNVIGGISKTIGKLGSGIGDFFSGKLKIGNLRLATGTDSAHPITKPTMAILNDGSDSPGTNNREGLLHPNGLLEYLSGTNILRMLLPGDEVIKASDMAKLPHFAGGTARLQSREEAQKIAESFDRREKLSRALLKVTKKSFEWTKKHTKKSKHKKSSKNDPFAKWKRRGYEVIRAKHLDYSGRTTYVDSSVLTGRKRRTGKIVAVSTKWYKKYEEELKRRERAARKREQERKKRERERKARQRKLDRERTAYRRRKARTTRRTTRVRSYSYSGGGSTSRNIRVSVIGSRAVKSLSSYLKNIYGYIKAINKLKLKSLNVKYSGTYKAKVSLGKLVKAIKSYDKTKVKAINVKYAGTYKAKKSVDRLRASLKAYDRTKVKKIKVKYSGTYKARKSISKLISAIKELGSKKTQKHLSTFEKNYSKMSNQVKKINNALVKDLEKSFKSGESHINSDFDKFSKRFRKGWTNLCSGVRKTFNHFWTIMKREAGHGVNSVLRILNSGISKIDSVISEFGGKKSAVHHVGMVHYASGTGALGTTRRAITKPTLAVLNDGNDSPETGNKETIWDTRTNEFGVIQGRNTPFLLQPGQEVLNATESKMLGFTHYASGTGALKHLYELAKKFWKNPVKTGESNFGEVSGLTGAIKELAKGMRSKAKSQGVNWWSQLWKMVENKVDSDGGASSSGLVKAMEKYGSGHRYVLGTHGPITFDCSGLVQYALQHAYGISLPAPSGNQYAMTKHISRSQARPGDLVFFGPAGSEHVGVYAGGDDIYSAMNPHDGIGMSKIRYFGHPLFGRVPGLKPKSDKSKVSVKANTKLQKLIRSQVGSGFWKTIQKIADKFGSASLGRLGGSIKERARQMARFLKGLDHRATKEGIAAILGSWEFESGGLNPHAVNPNGGASGLGQWLGGRKSNLMAYARRHGKSWTDAATQIRFALNGEGSDSATFRRILESHGSPASLATEFSRLWERGGYDAQHASAARQIAGAISFANGGIADRASIFGEAGPEMAIPLTANKTDRAWSLVGKTMAILSKHSGSNSLQALQEAQNEKLLNESLETIILLMRQLLSKDKTIDVSFDMDGRKVFEGIKKYIKQDQRRSTIQQRRGLSGHF